MIVKEIKVKSCMTKSKITDYVINPYVGCQHSCKYCYATFIRKFRGIEEKWGDFVYVKINCSELLEKELAKNKPGHIWLSSVTDPYLPLEGKYKLTRKILKTIAKSPYRKKFTIEILTKSALIRRDFDLLKRLNVELSCSINTLSSKVAGILEPFASSPLERIKVLKEAKERGIEVYGFISPVLPGITDLDELFKNLKFCNYIWIELLNTKESVLERLIPALKNFPDVVKRVEFMINNLEEYYEAVKKEVESLEKKYGLKVIDIVRHDKT